MPPPFPVVLGYSDPDGPAVLTVEKLARRSKCILLFGDNPRDYLKVLLYVTRVSVVDKAASPTRPR
jgi:hypothetical protein